MNDAAQPVRIDTGVSGLNDILSGGLPIGQMYLLEGTPGTGKTTIALQFVRTASDLYCMVRFGPCSSGLLLRTSIP
jgi:predicted ATP-dependent serine protease